MMAVIQWLNDLPVGTGAVIVIGGGIALAIIGTLIVNAYFTPRFWSPAISSAGSNTRSCRRYMPAIRPVVWRLSIRLCPRRHHRRG
jgi:hypothetical protein